MAKFYWVLYKVINGYAIVTDLTLASSQPDGWNKINVKYAQAPFTRKTICSIFSYLDNELGCHKAMLFDGNIAENKGICDTCSERLKTLEMHLLIKQNTHPNNSILSKWESELAGLEYSETVGSLFNEIFWINQKPNMKNELKTSWILFEMA